MGLLTNLFEKRSFSGAVADRWYTPFSPTTNSGAAVDERTALRMTAVWRCVRILSETIASLPLNVYERREDGGKRKAVEHPLFDILHNQPHEDMTSFTFREALVAHLVSWGNGYAVIGRGRDGSILDLILLTPDVVEAKVEGNQLRYEVRVDGDTIPVSKRDILHVPGLGFNGLKGYSPIGMAREAIGLGQVAEEFSARFFANDARPGVVLSHPGELSEDAMGKLRRSWAKMHQGTRNTSRPAILEEGMTLSTVGIPQKDAQFLESRKFQIQEIARIFGVPPHMLADLERATFSNIEHQAIDFVKHTIRPWLVRLEQTYNAKLLRPEERKRYFIEHVVDGLLRGDTTARYEAYNKGFQVGAFSINDILELENRNPIGPDGDQRFVPMNMIPVSQAGKTPTLPEEEPEEGVREHRSAANRFSITRSYEGIFEDAARRIVRREKADLERAITKFLGERSPQEFDSWLEDFYRDAVDWVGSTFRPAVKGLSAGIYTAASEEAGGDGKMTADAEEQVDEYIETFAVRYTGSSRGQIRAIVRDSLAEGLDPAEELATRLEGWEDTRPGKVAKNETVRLAGMVAKTAFVAAGIVRLRWAAIGPDVCPYCDEMDGKVVGVENNFVNAGDNFEPDGADGRFQVTGPVSHPPLHAGCVCTIVPE